MLITKPKAIKLLEEAVARRGADTSTACRYSKNDAGTEPQCLIGEVLYSLDPNILVKIHKQGMESAGAKRVLEEPTIIPDNIKFSEPAIKVLDAAQTLQDGRDHDGEFVKTEEDRYRRHPWGEVLEIVKTL